MASIAQEQDAYQRLQGCEIDAAGSSAVGGVVLLCKRQGAHGANFKHGRRKINGRS